MAELVGAELYTGAALLTRGMTLRNLGRLGRAAADFERAASLHERHGSNRVAWAYANLAFVYENRGALASARRLFENALPIAERAPDV